MKAKTKIDIHDYQIRYEAVKREINHKAGIKENAELILEFDNDMIHEGLSVPRRIRIITLY